MKTCTKCGEAKPVTEYYSNGRGGNGRVGRHSSCKACMTKAATADNQRRAAERRKGNAYVAQVEAAAKLAVGPCDEPDVFALTVDASALMDPEDDHHPRYWTLYAMEEAPGRWVHPESGGVDTLSEHLRAIACVYLARAEEQTRG